MGRNAAATWSSGETEILIDELIARKVYFCISITTLCIVTVSCGFVNNEIENGF